MNLYYCHNHPMLNRSNQVTSIIVYSNTRFWLKNCKITQHYFMLNTFSWCNGYYIIMEIKIITHIKSNILPCCNILNIHVTHTSHTTDVTKFITQIERYVLMKKFLHLAANSNPWPLVMISNEEKIQNTNKNR